MGICNVICINQLICFFPHINPGTLDLLPLAGGEVGKSASL